MFLLSINASSERNRERLCKTMRKIFHYKSRTNHRRVKTNKSHVDLNSSHLEIEVMLFKKLFWSWCSCKEWSVSFIFFLGGRRLENPTEKESSDLFGLLAPFCCILSTLVGSPWISWQKAQVNCKLFSGILYQLFLKKEIRPPSVQAYCSLLIIVGEIVRAFKPINTLANIFTQIRKVYSQYYGLVYAKLLHLLNLSDVFLDNSG